MALKSTSCSILLHRGSQPGDLRSCTYVISFPGPHSELPVSLFAPVRTSRPAQQTCPSACPCPGSSLRDFAPRCSFVWGCQMRCGASVTCAPLRRRQIACFSRACPYPAAALLCHLGPLLHFRKSASGCCQPPPAGREGHWQPTSVTALGGPAASIQLRQGPRAAGGPRNLPTARPGGPHIARWAARCAAAAGLQPAKHAAGGLEPTPGRCCGLGPRALRRASPSHRTGDWAHVPARTALAGMFVTDPQTARGLRLVYYALPSTTTVLAQVSRSRCKLWPRLRSAKAPWGFLRVRL
jgi:hypothetical protein